MVEAKKLVMYFKNDMDKTVSITVDDPRDNLTETEVKTAMDLILEKAVFTPSGYALTSTVNAKVINTQTNEYDLVVE